MDSSKTHADWMKTALEQARLSGDDVPVGCVIVRDGVPSAWVIMKEKRPVTRLAHAEIVALRQASQKSGTWRLADTTLYTTLEPCPMCAEAIIQSRVSKVVFGAYDNVSGALGSKFNLFCTGRIYPLPEVLAGVEENACREILVNYFAQKAGR